jgi:hypothetical protein
MLEFIKEMPPQVVGIRATGDVSKEDYEKVLVPRIGELVNRQGDINYLLVLETDVQNFSAASWFEDLKLGLKHFTHWNRIAVVTDQKGVAWFTDLFRFLIPGTAKGFTIAELEEAKKWITEPEAKDGTGNTAEPPSDNDRLEPVLENSSNKGQGPAGENL